MSGHVGRSTILTKRWQKNGLAELGAELDETAGLFPLSIQDLMLLPLKSVGLWEFCY